MSRWDDVQANFDVPRFLRRNGFDVTYTESNQIVIKCPRCHDHKHRLYIDKRTKNWICHNCPAGTGRGRSVLGFVEWVLQCDDVTAMAAIVESGAKALYTDEEEEPSAPKRKPLAEMDLPEGFHPLVLPETDKSRPFWDYLMTRNIAPSMVTAYGMGYCRIGRYKGRIILPVTLNGVRYGFVGRTIYGDVKKKYDNPDALPAARLLFNFDQVVDSGTESIVVVEGPFDALRLPHSAVCTFGKKISGAQMALIEKAGFRRVTLCYDGDAFDSTEYYSHLFPPFMDCYKAELPAEYDPGNAPMLVLSNAIRDAVRVELTR